MPHGKFHWNELMTRDAEKAKTFFADTLGWEYEAFGPGEAYWVIMVDGQPAGGIMPMGDDVPPEAAAMAERWMAYIEVDDVDARLAKVKDAGGTVLKEPFEIPMVGRIAMVADAGGAVIGWITPVEQQG